MKRTGGPTGKKAGAEAPKRVAVVACPGVMLLDVTGPCEVFAAAGPVLRSLGRTGGYEVEILATGDVRIETSSGVSLLARSHYTEGRGRIDTLLFAGGPGVHAAAKDAALLRWLRRAGRRVRRVGSVCTGAFVLAAAGLLDGRRATTHWAFCDRLAREFPAVTVDPDPIFVRDGDVSTSAGVTAGMDLALALVEDDYGRDVATRVARHLVMFIRRPGGQSQFSELLEAQAGDRGPLRDLLGWVAEHPDEDLSVEALAARAHMSSRNFARVFARRVGRTPARFVERVRVDAARRRLEESDAGLEEVAAGCGFGSADAMRRVFLRVVRVTPGDYRKRFRTKPAGARPSGPG